MDCGGALPQAAARWRMIVGRDPDRLDAAGVGRAAVESLAENLSDGVVAPLFWGVVAGLPGMLAYKAINTLDSMVGHRNERYREFGWASARLDDLVNLAPARLTGPSCASPAALRAARLRDHAARRAAATARPTPAGPRPRWPAPSASASPAPASMPGASSRMPGWATAAPKRRPATSTAAIALAWRAWWLLARCLSPAAGPAGF